MSCRNREQHLCPACYSRPARQVRAVSSEKGAATATPASAPSCGAGQLKRRARSSREPMSGANASAATPAAARELIPWGLKGISTISTRRSGPVGGDRGISTEYEAFLFTFGPTASTPTSVWSTFQSEGLWGRDGFLGGLRTSRLSQSQATSILELDCFTELAQSAWRKCKPFAIRQ